MPDLPVRSSALPDLDPRTLYLLAKLRQDVFTLEQGATDADLDGRELDPGTEILWIEQDGEPIAHLRIVREEDGAVRIGRLAVRADRRRGGTGRTIMQAGIARARELAAGAEIRIDAQAYLEQWYRTMGFETTSGLFMEAGIEHVAMVLRPAAPR